MLVEPGGGPGSGSGSSAAPLPVALGEGAINSGGGATQAGRVQECEIEECDRGVRVRIDCTKRGKIQDRASGIFCRVDGSTVTSPCMSVT